MSEEGNADIKRGERKMEREDSVRTVDCLRGRLLAERVASRNAKEEAEQLGNKLMELENLLKQEAKSRNKAEKKLKHLMKKLESMNISYISDESEHSGLVDKSDISSTNCSVPKSQQQKESEKLHQNDSQKCLLSLSDDSSTIEDTPISANLLGLEREMERDEDRMFTTVSEILEKDIACNPNACENSDKSSSKMDQQSDTQQHAITSADDGLNDVEDQDSDDQIDNSLALVPVSTPQENHTIDPEVLDATVKEVLDALRFAKEQLQSSMERRRTNMIKVG